MLLRSGTIYKPPISPPKIKKCADCNRFWGNPDWKMLCSICSGYCDKNNVSPYWGFNDPEYQKKLIPYVKDATKESRRYIPVLSAAAEQLDITMLKEILTIMRIKEIFLTAEQAYPLLRNKGADTNQKSHLICQFIFDWWNMKKYPYNSTEMCYFGHFGDEPETKDFPPPLPNGSLLRGTYIPYPP